MWQVVTVVLVSEGAVRRLLVVLPSLPICDVTLVVNSSPRTCDVPPIGVLCGLSDIFGASIVSAWELTRRGVRFAHAEFLGEM